MLNTFDPANIRSLIAGEVIASDRTSPVQNPHNGDTIAQLHLASENDVVHAIQVAKEAWQAWAAVPPVERGRILHLACNLIETRGDELSAIVAKEAGKPLKDAKGETAGAIQCGRFFAGEGQRLFGRTMPSGAPNKSAMTVRQPCGVAALITAANTPAPNFAWKVFPALICGNAVVLKPAEDTPMSADWMARALIAAGVPTRVLNVLQGLGAEVGGALTSHEDVDVISFTGSTRVGRMIAEQAGRRLTKISLELGGKNAFIVCDDADLEKATTWAVASAFSNAGQRCAAGSRFIIMSSVYDAFLAKFVEKTKGLKLGVDDDCALGPVINARQRDNILAAVAQAKKDGATVHCGGGRATGHGLDMGFYIEPTIIHGAAPETDISRLELFGPVANLYRVETFAEAVAMANNSPYGLTACIHTQSFDRAWTFAREIRTGVAVVNAGTFGSEPHMPFGGLRASGNGTREPGTEALDIYTELKDIYLITEPSRL